MASSRSTTQAIAKLQARDIERAVRRSTVLSSRFWRMAVEAARRNFKHDAKGIPKLRKFDPVLKQAVLDELLDLMAYSYLMRLRLGDRRRARTKRAKVGLRLESQVHKDARRFATMFELDLEGIKDKFRVIAKKAIGISEKDIRDTMNAALERSTIAGNPTYVATEDVIESLRKHGIEPRSSSYVEKLVRTHSAIAYGAAHRVSFIGDTDLWGWEYVTVGDDRVRPEHEILDGILRRKDDEFWDTFWPPNGWNCRCQAVAVYDDDAKQTPVPDDAEPDEGFDFDPAELILGD